MCDECDITWPPRLHPPPRGVLRRCWVGSGGWRTHGSVNLPPGCTVSILSETLFAAAARFLLPLSFSQQDSRERAACGRRMANTTGGRKGMLAPSCAMQPQIFLSAIQQHFAQLASTGRAACGVWLGSKPGVRNHCQRPNAESMAASPLPPPLRPPGCRRRLSCSGSPWTSPAGRRSPWLQRSTAPVKNKITHNIKIATNGI